MKEIKKNGFTLIELLVVISIIAILTVIISSSFVSSQQKSRDASRKSELKSLSDALNMYYADKGVFPPDTGIGSTAINSLISSGGEFADNSNPDNKIIYMKKVPVGTGGGAKQMFYETSAEFKSFRLYANLENDDDKDCVKDSEGVNPTTLNGVYTVSAGSCIYLLTSSNASVDSLP
jgi:type II secretion system protein G